jgi:hypothetical protein
MLHQWSVSAFAVSIMLSPEIISKAGSFYGRAGFFGFLLVGLILLLYILLVTQYQYLYSQRMGLASNDHLLRNVFGPIAAVFLLAVKIIALLFLATGLLVTSGYVFNEIFLYWFPNFGFAFILLICLVLLQWFGHKQIKMLQIVFSGLTFSGLLVLIIFGFLQKSFFGHFAGPEPISTDLLSVDIIFVPVIFFLGVDLGLIHLDNTPLIHSLKPMKHTIVIMGLFLLFWGLMALGHVPVEKLSQTTVSHVLIAKSVLGEKGRYIMGIVVISGTLAAINALLAAIKIQTRTLLKQQGVKRERQYPLLLILILGITIGVLMAKGLAGHDILENLITGALILWLISYAWIPLLNIIATIRSPKHLDRHFLFILLKQLLVFLPIILSVMIFIATSKKPEIILKLISIAFTISFVIGAAFNLRTRTITK